MKKKLISRNSNIEVLRIISMFLILVSHYTVHNGVNNWTLPIGINRIVLESCTLGNIGVIIFILIMGYYSIGTDKPLKFKKLVLLYIQMLFYSVTIFILFGKENINIKNIISSLMPFSFNAYWFMTVYLLLYCFSPFINKLINNLKRNEHLLLIYLGFFFLLLKTITFQEIYVNQFFQFILFYIIGSYFKKYNDNFFSNRKNNIIVLISSILVLILSVIVFDFLGIKITMFGKHSTYLFARTSPIAILCAISIFNLFIFKKPFYNNFLNGISSSVLSVYLISDNYYIREILWSDMLKVYHYIYSSFLPIHLLVSVLLIFILCVMIDYLRKKTFEKLVAKMYDFISSKICKNKYLKKYYK